MSILKRVQRLAKANLTAWTGKTDDAEEALTANIEHLERSVEAACEALAQYAAVFKRAEQEHRALTPKPATCLERAETALREGDEAQARRALAEKLKAEQRLDRLGEEVVSGRAVYTELQAQLRAVREQLDAAQRRLRELQARGRAAEAQRAMGRHAERVREDGIGGDTFRAMETTVLAAEAATEIEEEIRGGALSDDRLERLQKEQVLDAEMEALKRQIATGNKDGH